MNTTIAAIDARVVSPIAATYSDAPALLHLQAGLKASRLVLQPRGSLQRSNGNEFQQALEKALEQVTDGVVVDLLWVDSIDADGVMALVVGMQRARLLGKCLSFQSMNASIRLVLETAWERQQTISHGAWAHTFNSDLEVFLDNSAQTGRNRITSRKYHGWRHEV